MTERQIQRAIYGITHGRYQVVMPNYTPARWWECDMFGVTKAGYGVEWEIKVTVSDFRADADKKRQDSWRWIAGQRQDVVGKRKHDLLSAQSTDGPSRFYYVLPESLAHLQSELPTWAGLWLAIDRGRCVNLREVVKAPRLHTTPVKDSIIRHALGVCYYRYWNERAARDYAGLAPIAPDQESLDGPEQQVRHDDALTGQP